ncbi:hypothetical protein SAMD00019534_008650 [Acytostelium subglobosum LB1]|uniref:hypothetical protein n=1 Tax=Acytostelium subglobosum LB1 TaxID=1410327 RepID=UPI0006448A97|nr:hypothetical protein SAMD00019534_008650 [Acytostelium subglobosum LB1]GAM17690.1 hypothetical protein SAMD00019534_008650 [Acytostelium subglobosum LB1]|eukprot:XP_012758286.1 hypothetical protein SAMD00019534_008650 [Acytostelium subglobosum LB1]
MINMSKIVKVRKEISVLRTTPAFQAYIKEMLLKNGNIDLSKLKQGEADLVSAYEDDILNADTVTYIAYDFNEQLKGNRIDSLDCVIDDTVTYIATYNLNYQLKGNCMDSLDHDEPARGHQSRTARCPPTARIVKTGPTSCRHESP